MAIQHAASSIYYHRPIMARSRHRKQKRKVGREDAAGSLVSAPARRDPKTFISG